ncbi:MAG TPA: ATPase domain-containing protein, partial [archaeon]|nr:ATPase domain-containing protein [archaeon]
GKTILCTQFLYNGAVSFQEPGIFISFEEGKKNLGWNIQSFGWNVEELRRRGLLEFYTIRPKSPEEFLKNVDREFLAIEALAAKMNAKRLVIDSTTAFGVWLNEPGTIRYKLFDVIEKLKALNITTLLTAETKGGLTDLSAFGVEEFVADGVIAVYFSPPLRALSVRKMRGTDHSKKIHPLEIGRYGVTVNYNDEILKEALR